MEAEEASSPPPPPRNQVGKSELGAPALPQASCNLKTHPRPVFQMQFLRPLLGRPYSWPGGEPGGLLVNRGQRQEWEVLNSRFERRGDAVGCAPLGGGRGAGPASERRSRDAEMGVVCLAERRPVW